MRFVVLINSSAGSVDDAEALGTEIVQAFSAAGAAATVEAVPPEDLDEAIRRAWDSEPRPAAVVIAGGDGTVNGAAAVAAGTEIVLSVLPLGTFNHFAKDLGIPDDLAGAAAAIANGSVRDIDVAEVNGEVFVNNSALGVYPAMVALRDRITEARGWGKVRAVPVACVRVLRDLPTHRLDLIAEGWSRSRMRTSFVFVGNGRYDNGTGGAAHREDLADGRLGVVVARTETRRGLVGAALKALVSGAGAVGDLEEVETAELKVDGRTSRLRVARDGEISWMDLPLRYRSRPGALKVYCPAPTAGG